MHTQAPRGAGRNRTQALLTLRAGRAARCSRGDPRKRGPGKGDYEHKVLIWSRPRRRFGDFAAGGKVTRRPQTAKLPCVQRIQSETCPLIRLALRPATFPPGGRLKKERRRNSPRRTKDAPALALNDQRGRVLILGKEPEQPVRTERPRPRSSAACVCGPVWCRPHSPAG